jgi:hypothetical protein
MKTKRLTGLITAGGVSQSFLARMPALLGAVGPVKAASLRVARRIVNSLRAGYAVDDYSALESCQLIWLAVPEAAFDRVTRELVVQIPLENKMIVLCGSTRDSLGPVTGARVASLNPVEKSDERTLVAEGHPDVVRELRRLAVAEKRKLIRVRSGLKPMYLAGIYLATHLTLPWIAAAVESLRAAGFTRAEATRTVEALGNRTLRAYGKAGRKAWSHLTAVDLRRSVEHDLRNISAADPRLAALYAAGVAQTLGFFELGSR